MAADIIQKIVVVAAAAADSVVAVDVPQDGHIETLMWNFRGQGMDALNDGYAVELSFASSNTFANNDSRISIIEVASHQNFLTTGGGNPHNVGVIRPEIPVFAGERLHVHVNVSGGITSVNGVFYLYYRTRAAAPPRRSARRR